MSDYLITGSSGFLGSFIYHHCKENGKVVTIGRQLSDSYQIDLRNNFSLIESAKTIIHCAGKAHSVPKTEQEKQDFFDVNTVGTLNLLTALKNAPSLPETFIFISTIAVYGLESGIEINEKHPLLGSDPYAKSKIEAEQLITNWGIENNVQTVILRLPLIAGINPPGNLGNMIKALKSGRYLSVNNGKAKKSMVLADDVAKLVSLGKLKAGIYNLTDGKHLTFFELENLICSQLKLKKPKNIPMYLAKLLGLAGDVIGSKFPVNSNTINKITSTLTFSDLKAREDLNWKPLSVIEHLKIQ